MSPDKRARRQQSRPSPDQADVPQRRFVQGHRRMTPTTLFTFADTVKTTRARQFLHACPVKVRATMRAVLMQVAAAPPKRFAGGGYWEAMKGAMTGWFEVRVDGQAVSDSTVRRRLQHVRDLGAEYLHRNPRALA